jgi:hypothetical protein
MNDSIRGLVADRIAETIAAAGIRPHTGPWISAARLFGPIFETAVPMRKRSLRSMRRDAGVFGIVALFSLTLFFFVLPLDLLRLFRARKQHRAALARLAARDEALAAAARAPGLVVVDFRVEHDGRLRLSGTAIASVEGKEPSVHWVDAHVASPPADAPDANAVAAAIGPLAGAPPQVAHWEWQLEDPFALVVRESCPW